MKEPAISVVLPAYNCGKWLAQAIRSILDQTLSDLELIIINDGSTDQTEFIILSFPDPRIVYLKNPQNAGLIYSLNRGIETAKGDYIARMDADDICLPERLEKQKAFLDSHPDIAMVSCAVVVIDENDRETGTRELDKRTITPKQIRHQMPYENCIPHPTAMVRAMVFRQLLYKPYQVNIEDYDCWLRLLNRGYQISKIEQPLLLYRSHDASITGLYLKNTNFFITHLRMKCRFLAGEISEGRIRWFTLRVAGAALLDGILGVGKSVKKLFR